ncbi:MAG: UvrD-helicase domain-containing protein [Christensenellales bacterium]
MRKYFKKKCNIFRLWAKFEVIDEEEQVKILNEIYKKSEINRRVLSPKVAIKAISDFKNKSCLELVGLLKTVYNEYQTFLKENNMMDFEDLLVLTYQLFKENPNILEYYQDEFKYILVDELQDTNVVQYDIINLLCQKYEKYFLL